MKLESCIRDFYRQADGSNYTDLEPMVRAFFARLQASGFDLRQVEPGWTFDKRGLISDGIERLRERLRTLNFLAIADLLPRFHVIGFWTAPLPNTVHQADGWENEFSAGCPSVARPFLHSILRSMYRRQALNLFQANSVAEYVGQPGVNGFENPNTGAKPPVYDPVNTYLPSGWEDSPDAYKGAALGGWVYPPTFDGRTDAAVVRFWTAWAESQGAIGIAGGAAQ